MKDQPVAPRVSVLVPSAEHLGLLEACLQSLVRHGPRSISFEVIVVLNFSPGPAVARLSALDLDLRLIRSPVNLGLAGAGNRARAEARGELLVLLHDDAEIEPGWLEALVETADLHPEAGAVGGKVLFPDRTLQNAGMILWRDGQTSPPWIGAAPEATAFDELRAVDYCGTSSLLVGAGSWDAAGGLDERYFPAYYVDVDLAMQIRRLGQVVLYQPRSVIRHHRGASGDIRFRQFVTSRNRRLFISKWSDDLKRQEPNDGDPEIAIARAIDRAARRGQEAKAGHARAISLVHTSTPSVDSVTLQERHNLERHVALLQDYAADLTGALAHASERVAAAARELAEIRAREAAWEVERTKLLASAAVLERITSLRWWRLYTGLLPILKRLRGNRDERP